MPHRITPIRLGTLSLSNRLYAALRLFADERRGFIMDTKRAREIDQRSFGAIFHRGYIRFDPAKEGFVLTELGKRAKQSFDDTDVYRKNATPTFSHYLNAIKALRRIA